MDYSFLRYFIDPVLRGPTVGGMLMCFSVALVGVIPYLRKQSLVGEVLSHAAYPGVALGVLAASVMGALEEEGNALPLFMMGGAFITSMGGLFVIHLLVQKLSIKNDAALCFTLASFFGAGIALVSYMQFSYAVLYRHIQTYLYGQIATMTDAHILIYGIASLLVLLVILALFKEIKVLAFDRDFATSLSLPVRRIEAILYVLIGMAVVVGIRSVGVVLLSAMLISPAVSARQYTDRLSRLFVIAAFVGVVSGFLGNYLSVEFAEVVEGQRGFSLPTGPVIVVVAATICLFSLLFAPKRGIVARTWRLGRFRYSCLQENFLKMMWKIDPDKLWKKKELFATQGNGFLYLQFVLLHLLKNGWLLQSEEYYRLTEEGKKRGARITRLHRLWELYLVEQMGMKADRVHKSAEEIEHILTPEIERKLTELLNDPKEDPHHQPIPQQ